LTLYLGLYIKTELFASIPDSLGIPILFHILGVALSVLFEITWMLIKPFFEPGVIVSEVVRVPFSPAGMVFRLMGFLAEGISTGLLPFTHPWIGYKQTFAITTPLPFHPGPLSTWL